MDQLKAFRDQIDQIDNKIIRLLFERFELVKEIGDLKKQNNIEVLQSNRWDEVLNSKKTIAKDLWLSDELIDIIWNAIHDYALKLQK